MNNDRKKLELVANIITKNLDLYLSNIDKTDSPNLKETIKNEFMDYFAKLITEFEPVILGKIMKIVFNLSHNNGIGNFFTQSPDIIFKVLYNKYRHNTFQFYFNAGFSFNILFDWVTTYIVDSEKVLEECIAVSQYNESEIASSVYLKPEIDKNPDKVVETFLRYGLSFRSLVHAITTQHHMRKDLIKSKLIKIFGTRKITGNSFALQSIIEVLFEHFNHPQILEIILSIVKIDYQLVDALSVKGIITPENLFIILINNHDRNQDRNLIYIGMTFDIYRKEFDQLFDIQNIDFSQANDLSITQFAQISWGFFDSLHDSPHHIKTYSFLKHNGFQDSEIISYCAETLSGDYSIIMNSDALTYFEKINIIIGNGVFVETINEIVQDKDKSLSGLRKILEQ